MISVKICSKIHLSEADKDHLYALMIRAYEATERDIWGPNYSRMEQGEFYALLSTDSILIAFLNDKIVGSVHFYPVSKTRYSFGLLNADFNESGQGIGRALVREAEIQAKSMGALEMQLEILRPDHLIVPQKEQLKNWYKSMGYGLIATNTFLELKPDKVEKAKTLINPSSFDVYAKIL